MITCSSTKIIAPPRNLQGHHGPQQMTLNPPEPFIFLKERIPIRLEQPRLQILPRPRINYRNLLTKILARPKRRWWLQPSGMDMFEFKLSYTDSWNRFLKMKISTAVKNKTRAWEQRTIDV